MTLRPWPLALLLLVSGCGGGSGSPTTPTPAPLNITGVWDSVTTLTGGSGQADCINNWFIGQQFQGVVNIQQSGTSITATSTDNSTGFQCSYTGTLTDGQFFATLSSCNLTYVRTTCASGTVYDLRTVTQSINGTASSTTINGTVAETINIFLPPPAPFPQQGQFPSGSVSLQSTIRLTKR
ncbi:MAG: hypothetical protein AMXMBFR57_17730 [Acidimicrobiia bacterium]